MKQKFLGFIAYIIYSLWSLTYRFKIVVMDQGDQDQLIKDIKHKGASANGGYLYAFFHQDELSLVPFLSYTKSIGIVSASKDGEIMNTMMRLMGYQTVRGSSSRKGVQAFLGALKLIKQGYKFGNAVDGPRGPIYVVKEGIIKLSEKSQRPIVPIRAYPEKYFVFKKSWNKAKLPYPFSRIIVICGKPAMYTREELEKAMLNTKIV